METCDFEAYILPVIEIYGGDTTQWEVTLMKDKHNVIPYDMAKDYVCTLTLSHYNIQAGLGDNADTTPPVLTKPGTIERMEDGSSLLTFSFVAGDTMNLRGIYRYQIEVVDGAEHRAAQGRLYIKHNINRT